MKKLLNFIDFNYDDYIVWLSLIAIIAFIIYVILKNSEAKKKLLSNVTFAITLISMVVILVGAYAYLNSDVGVEASYKAQNDSLVVVNKNLVLSNDSLRNLINKNDTAILVSNKKLVEFKKQISNIKNKYDEKINVVDNYNSDEFDRFFELYKTRYYLRFSGK